MQIPSYELQKRIFGYATDELPPEGSFKAKVYDALNQGLNDGQIEKIAQSWKRIQDVTQCELINPIVEKQARLN